MKSIKNCLVRHQYSYRFNLVDDDGVVIDLTGKTVKFILNDSVDNNTPVISENCTIVDAENGICDITLTASDTDIEPGKYYAQLDIYIDPDTSNPNATKFSNDFQMIMNFKESLS